MAHPAFHKGDVVRIETGYSFGDQSHLQKYKGELAVVTELTGRKRRAKGSRITYGLYRVYIPKHNVYRTARACYLQLQRPVPGKRRYGEGSEGSSVAVLYETSPGLDAEILSLFKGGRRPKDTRKRPKGMAKGNPYPSEWREAALTVMEGRKPYPPLRGGW